MRVFPHIYQVLGDAYTSGTNIFAIQGSKGVILVDTGENELELEITLANLKDWNIGPITDVLISHRHYGHFANTKFYRDQGAKIYAGAADAEAIESDDMNIINDCQAFPLRPVIPCTVDVKLQDKDSFEAAGIQVKAYHVPGHTAGSMFFEMHIDGKDIMFTGDVLNVDADGTKATLGWMGGYDFNLKDAFKSVKYFSQFTSDVILPQHHHLCLQNGAKIFQDAYAQALLQWRGPFIAEE